MKRALSRENIVGLATSFPRRMIPGMAAAGRANHQAAAGRGGLTTGDGGGTDDTATRSFHAFIMAIDERLSKLGDAQRSATTTSASLEPASIQRLFSMFSDEVKSMFVAHFSTTVSPVESSDAPPLQGRREEGTPGSGSSDEAGQESRMLSASSSNTFPGGASSTSRRSPAALIFSGTLQPTTRPRCTKQQESALLLFISVCWKLFALVERVASPAACDLVLTDSIVALITNPPTKRIADAATQLLGDIMVMSATVAQGTVPVIHRALFSASGVRARIFTVAEEALSGLRLLSALHGSLRSFALTSYRAKQVTADDFEQGLGTVSIISAECCRTGFLADLIELVSQCHQCVVGDAPAVHRHVSRCTVLVGMSAINAMVAGDAIGKGEALLRIQQLSNVVSRHDYSEVPSPALTATFVNAVTGRQEEHAIVMGTAAFYASEFTELIVEAVVTGCPSYQRQRLEFQATGATTGSKSSAAVPSGGNLRRAWEPLPPNWDALLVASPDVMPW